MILPQKTKGKRDSTNSRDQRTETRAQVVSYKRAGLNVPSYIHHGRPASQETCRCRITDPDKHRTEKPTGPTLTACSCSKPFESHSSAMF